MKNLSVQGSTSGGKGLRTSDHNLPTRFTDNVYTFKETMYGRRLHPANEDELVEAVECAVDYRGDVTVHLHSGEVVEGYVFNRNRQAGVLVIELFCNGNAAPVRIPSPHIRAIEFTGEDTASGKSWQAWVKKKEEERQAESRHLESEARARGHL